MFRTNIHDEVYETVSILVLFSVFLLSCNQQPQISLAEETEKILALHHSQRGYHFNKDSVAFANQFTSDFVSVNRGEITPPSKEETIARYHRYFSSVEFLKWDDVSEPIIRFSEDATMAYTIVDKVVRVKYLNPEGEEEEGETHFAWTAIYRKTNGEWKIDCVTSTNK